MLILMYFYLGKIFNAWLWLVTEYFYTVVLLLLDVSTSSTTGTSLES